MLQGQMQRQEHLNYSAETATSWDHALAKQPAANECAASFGCCRHSRPTEQPHIKQQLPLAPLQVSWTLLNAAWTFDELWTAVHSS